MPNLLGVKPSYATGFAQWPGISEYPQLWTGLVATWAPFLGVTGGQVFDLSGNGNHGTFVGDVSWTASKFGLATDFPGSADYIIVPDNDILRFNSATQDFSVFVCARSTVATPQDILLDKRDGNDNGWVFRTVAGVVWLSINGVDVKGSIDIGDGKWHFMGGVANRSGNGQIYIDGLPDGNPVDVSGQAMDTTIDMYISTTSYSVPSNEWVGQISHVMVYNRALTASEIALLYHLMKRYAA